jgi:asparagine synthase (glutamine-hydrolysing)
MCGICGIVARDSEAVISEPLLRNMTRVLAHRGPDDEQLHLEPGVGLGHRRLSIVDLSDRGRQPMANDDGSIRIVYNGEVYNHQAERHRLEGQGIRFRSDCDTEVVLRLYEQYGEDCLSHLRGMFAFAIWDAPQRKLFLVRDRLGQKPLYYREANGKLLFASEIKSLLQDESFQREPDLLSLHHFLTLDYMPGSSTGFLGIHELPAAHKLVYEQGQIRIEAYWDLTFDEAKVDRLSSPDEISAEVLRRLREAVEMRRMGDVPLGVFLSAGIDSAAVTALLRGLDAGPIQTFTMKMEDQDFDESSGARLTAEYFHTDHHEYPVRPDVVDLLPQLVGHMDQPFGDPSIIPTYLLAQAASQEITVALGGDGGDECLGGYDRYVKNSLAESANRLPPVVRKATASALRRLMPSFLPREHIARRLERFFQMGEMSSEELFCQWFLHCDLQLKKALYTDEFWESFGHRDSRESLLSSFGRASSEDLLASSLYVDCKTYLPGDILKKVDMASMAHSLELRSPFLDHEFMEFMAKVPSQFKLKGRTTKWILRKALQGKVPAATLRRPKKGFGLPVETWLRRDLKEMVHDHLLSPRARQRGYFRPEVVARLVDEHCTGKRNWHFQIWNLLVLELWHEAML